MVKRLGDSIKKTLDVPYVRRFREEMGRATREFATAPTMLAQQLPVRYGEVAERDRRGRSLPLGASAGSVEGGSGRGGGGRSQQRQPLGFGATALAAGVGTMGANFLQRAGSAAAGVAGGFGAISNSLGALPVIGPALSAMMHTAETLTDKAVGVQQQMLHGYGETGLGRLSGVYQRGVDQDIGLATDLGMAPQELAGALQGLARTSGLRGEALRRIAPQELQFQALTGAGAGTLAGAAGTSGGILTPERVAKLNKEAVQSAIEAGFRGARLGDYVQQVAGDISALRTQGILINPNSIFAVTQVLGRSGGRSLQGEAGLTAARSLTERIRGAGQGGDVFSAITAMVGQQMRPGQSAVKTYAEMQKAPEKFFGPVLKQIVKMGGPKDSAVAFMVANAGLSYQQASDIYDGVQNGKISDEAIQKIMSGEEGTRAADIELQRRKEEQRGAVGVVGEAAGLETQAVGAGMGVAGDVFKARRAEMKIAQRTAPYGARLEGAVGDLVEGGFKAYDQGGMGGLMKFGGEQLMQLLQSSLGALEKTFDGINDKIAKSLGFDGAVPMSEAFSKKGMSEVLDGLLEGLKSTFASFLKWLNTFLPKPMQITIPRSMERPSDDGISRTYSNEPAPALQAGATGL